MMLRFIPRASELGLDVTVLGNYDDRVWRKKRNDRDTRVVVDDSRDLSIHRKNQREARVSRRTLAHEVEVTQLDDLVSPELETRRFGHAEAVDVEDSSAHTELRDVLDHQHSLESDGFEMQRKIFRTPDVAFAKLESRLSERSRKLRALEQGACSREQNANVAARQTVEDFNSLTRNFGVRLGLAKSFAGRIECDGEILIERLEICEPSLCRCDALGDHDEQTTGRATSQRRDYCRVAGTKQAREVY